MVPEIDHHPQETVSRIVLQGIPWDVNSSFLRGTAQAPDHIREALHSASTNTFSESGLDLKDHPLFEDRGNLPLSGESEAMALIERQVAGILTEGRRPLLLGGDHALTYPALQAMGAHYTGLTVIHFDAHPDLYDELDGNRFSHACPFARVMESGRVARLIQVGIRSTTRHQREQAQRFGVEVHEMRHRPWRLPMSFTGPLYISLDMDVLDPAFAPGVSHFEPGGLTIRELIDILQGLKGPVVGADIVEFNPWQDASGRTAMVAAKLLKEIAALMIQAKNPGGEGPAGRKPGGVDVQRQLG
jgi:agmatinase